MALPATPAAAQDAEIPRFEPGPCPFETTAPVEGVDCGDLVVYENRDDPAEGTLRLAVAILRSFSDTPEPDPIVFLSGGPGNRSVISTPQRARSNFWNRHRQTRNIVFFDQRGTGYSNPTFCPGMNVTFSAVLYQGLSPTEVRTRQVAATRDCYERMRAEGVDFSRYNSATSARDLDDLRRALGIDRWNVLGGSYGARLALTAMRDTPDGIRSVILDSTLPPNVRGLVNRPSNLSRSLHLVFDQCAADAACRAAFPTLEHDFYALLDSLEREPIELAMDDTTRFPGGRLVIDDVLLLGGVFQGLYNRHFIPLLPLLVRETKTGHTDFWRALADQLADDPHQTSQGLQKSVRCYEDAPFNPPALIDSARAQYPRLAPFFETIYNHHAICDAWHDVRADSLEFRPVQSEIPTLILAGEFDPVTPPSYGRIAAQTLPNSTFIEAPALGHGVGAHTACTRDLMGAFWDAPSQPLDTRCVADLPPVSFVTDVHINGGVYPLAQRIQQGPGLPFMAGLGLMGLLLLSGVLAWPIGYVWRRLRGQRRDTTGLQQGARWSAGLASLGALAFLVGLALAIQGAAAANPFVLAFGVPGAAGWLFALPWIVAALTIAVAVLAVRAWRQGWWTPAHRAHYVLIATACVGFLAFVSTWGLW